MKQWTAEERAEHGRKIAEAKRRKAAIQKARRLAQQAAVVAVEITQRFHEQHPELQTPPKRLTWYDLPKDAIKCARNPLVPRDAEVHKSQCYNCRNEMWTRDNRLEDICEVCEYLLVNEKHRLRQEREKKRGGVMNNPFKVDNSGGAVINPFATGRRLL